MIKRLLPLTFILCLLPVLAQAATYYVATTGNNSNPGTQAQPWQTLQHAANTAVAGDTVYVRGGNYSEYVRFDHSGSAGGGFITFQNYPGETPVWVGFSDIAFDLPRTSYIKIIGFTFRDYVGGAITIYGSSSHVEIRNNTLLNQTNTEFLRRHGMIANSVYWPNVETMDSIIFDGNHLTNIESGWCPPESDCPFNEAMTIAHAVNGFQMTNNVLETIYYIGIDNLGHSYEYMVAVQAPYGGTVPPGTEPWPQRGLIAGNRIHLGLDASAYRGVPNAGIYFDGGKDTVVENNYIDDWQYYAIQVGSEEDDYFVERTIVRSNIVTNSYVGISCGLFRIGDANTRCAHNTVHNADSDSIGLLMDGHGTNVKWRNNISMSTSGTPIQHVHYCFNAPPHQNPCLTSEYDSPSLDYNLYYDTGTRYFDWKGTRYNGMATWQSASGQDAHSLTSNPLFVNPATGDFHLQSGSPAIDAGTPLTTAVGAGTNSTSLVVADALWFSDGKGQKAGDTIRVGGSTASVTAVNYGTNTLTLSTPLTWVNGAPVSYPYSGTAPDIGTYEFNSGVPPMTSVGPFYLATTGTDTVDCTAALSSSTPRRRMANVASCMAAGATVLWAPGTYTEDFRTSVTPIIGGSDTGYTVLKAATDGTVTLKSSTDFAPIFLDNGSSDHHIEIRGFVIDQDNVASRYGLVTHPDAHHIRLTALEIKETSLQSLVVYGTDQVQVTGCYIHHNLAGPLVEANQATNVTFSGNTISNGAAMGVKVFDGASNVRLEQNIIHTNAGAGVEYGGSSGDFFANNLLYGNARGVDILAGSNGGKIYNNTIITHTNDGIRVASGVTGAVCTNNILFGNGAALSGPCTAATNLTTDPVFAAPGPPANWHPTSPTAIGTGTTVAEVTNDFYNVPRPPPPAKYTIGATQEAESVPPPTPAVPTLIPPYRTTGFFGQTR